MKTEYYIDIPTNICFPISADNDIQATQIAKSIIQRLDKSNTLFELHDCAGTVSCDGSGVITAPDTEILLD